jgi:hypothetical protein
MLIVWSLVFLYSCFVLLSMIKGMEFQTFVAAALSVVVAFAVASSLQQAITKYLTW